MRVFRSVCLCLGAALNNEMRRFKARSGAFVASGIEANEVVKQVSAVRPAVISDVSVIPKSRLKMRSSGHSIMEWDGGVAGHDFGPGA